MAEVLCLARRVHVQTRAERHVGIGRATGLAAAGAHDHLGAAAGVDGVERLADAAYREGLLAAQTELASGVAGRELQRRDAHPDEVRAVDALEALGDDRAHAEQLRALRGPVAR